MSMHEVNLILDYVALRKSPWKSERQNTKLNI